VPPQSDYLTTGYENGSSYPGAIGPQENTFSPEVTGSGVPSGGNGCHRALLNYAKINRDKLEPGKDVILIDRTCSGAQIQPEPGGKPPIVGNSGQGIDPSSQLRQALDLLSAQGVYYFRGGQINSAFRFEQVCLEIAKALEAAGYDVSVTGDALSVTGVVRR